MDYSSLFTAAPEFFHLNAGTLSRTPLSVLAYAEEIRREEERNPTAAVVRSVGRFWQAQSRLAPFLGAKPEDIFLRSNITSALNDFLFGLELKGKGEFLATGFEYGATANLARVRAAQLGMDFRLIPMPLGPDVSASEIIQTVTEAFTDRTRLLVISHVVTGTGAILPVAEIASEARARGILVVVDGAHAVGAIPLDIGSLGVDFYGGNFHKWFLGPKGTAFGWVRPSLKVEWKFGGWASFSMPDYYRECGITEEAARRLFPGTMDSAPFQALVKVMEFWETQGAENLRNRQGHLRDLAGAEAERLGWERVSPRDPRELGPLVSFRLPAKWPSLPPAALATKIFHDCRVQLALPVVQGSPVVRLSPGVYATERELGEGLERLGAFPSGK